jgi:hypothetical protein
MNPERAAMAPEYSEGENVHGVIPHMPCGQHSQERSLHSRMRVFMALRD